jgi:hypothetical protein
MRRILCLVVLVASVLLVRQSIVVADDYWDAVLAHLNCVSDREDADINAYYASEAESAAIAMRSAAVAEGATANDLQDGDTYVGFGDDFVLLVAEPDYTSGDSCLNEGVTAFNQSDWTTAKSWFEAGSVCFMGASNAYASAKSQYENAYWEFYEVWEWYYYQ